ncbi:MAG: hypothetical protein ISS01_00525 [Nanoarchaeota archaeon]|nr:hypothetical protein [Nanoarchaeota archaeon]
MDTIYIIDNEPQVLESLVDMVTAVYDCYFERKVEIVTFNYASEAYNLLEKTEEIPTGIISDINMGEKNDIENLYPAGLFFLLKKFNQEHRLHYITGHISDYDQNLSDITGVGLTRKKFSLNRLIGILDSFS